MIYEFNLPLLKEIAEITYYLTLSAGAIITAIAAAYGVTLWKRDLVGREAYSAARRLVKQLHVTSRSCQKMRNSIYPSDRRVPTADERKYLTKLEIWRRIEAESYSNKIDEFLRVYDDYQDALLDARVLIGSTVYGATLQFSKELRNCITGVDDYIELLNDQRIVLYPSDPAIKIAREAFQTTHEPDDILTVRTTESREAAEVELLKFLHRKSIRQ